MSRWRHWRPAPDILAGGGLLAALATLFWKVRIFDHGTDPVIGLGPVDLYVEIIPTIQYGFSTLRMGHFPLWNPYQFCGEPFFAIGWTGLLYPPHWIRLFVDPLLSVEIMLVFHLFWAGFGMWLLARHLRLDALGGLCAATTFMWSGWLIHNNTLPGVIEVASWMPFVVLLSDRVAFGRRFAWLWLILALTCQIMIGLIEVFIHSMYLAGIFFLCRSVHTAWRGEPAAALRRAALATICVVAAVLLATPLLLPTIELSQQSTRAAGALSLEQVTGLGGTIPSLLFLRTALETKGFVSVGAWPLLALPLALAMRRNRVVVIASMLAAGLAASLCFGGTVFELYYRIPFIGGLFRRPMKFLDIYDFGQALLAGFAVSQLSELGRGGAAEVWRHPAWLGSLALGGAGLLWLSHLASWNWYVVAVVGLLLLFGLCPQRWLRSAILIALCVVQGATLFFELGDTHIRPMKRPEIFHKYDPMFERFQWRLGDSRFYLSPRFAFDPGLMSKQGQLRRMAVSIDYEPLATERYGKFFDRITTRTDSSPFAGVYYLEPTSRWHLMDLTSSKFFVMLINEPGEVYMRGHPAEFRPVKPKGPVRVYERLNVLPRTYLVGRSRTLPNGDAVLAALDDPAFDPRSEILLEAPSPTDAAPTAASGVIGKATITSYEPEHVVVSASATAPGFLLLGDLHYPGWEAWVDGREVPIERANYLFRAVRLDAGTHEVRFEYHPASFRIGLWLSALTALAIGMATIWSTRR